MTSGLPVVSGREAIRVFERLGQSVVRQRGSHIRFRHATDPSRKPLTIPDHRTLKPGLLRLKSVSVSPHQFPPGTVAPVTPPLSENETGSLSGCPWIPGGAPAGVAPDIQGPGRGDLGAGFVTSKRVRLHHHHGS
jgi:predicted RNA binding protein YcfA (HicA-like mRNA interferase family)